MKAAYFLGKERIETRDAPIPEIGPEDVLVHVAACGVCGTDVHIYHGDKGSAAVAPPVILGHELAGVVERTGSAVTSLRPGDRVTVDPNIYCGKCRYCRMGKKHLCEDLFAVGVNRDGGFAEYCAVPERQCFPLDQDIPLRYGAMTEPLACCLHGIDRAHIAPGGTVLVVGGGAIGLLLLQLARLSGAARVVVSEPVAMRRDAALRLGADGVIDPVREDVPARLTELLGEPGADTVIECAGVPAATEQAFRAAKRGSTLLLFSVPRPGSTYALPLEDVYQKELTIAGSFINPDTHGRAAALINSGVIDLAPVITHAYPVEKLDEAIRMQMSAQSLKVIVEPWHAD